MSEPTRRSLLTSTAFVALGAALPGLAVIASAVADTPTPIPEAYGFFTPAEAAFIDAAIANAVYHATGIRIRDLPIRPDKLVMA